MSLYELLFGNKDIPMTNEVSLDQDTKTIIIGGLFILTLGAIVTAKILTENRKPQKK